MAEDRRLVERLRQGDRDALRRIYEKYKDDLLTIAGCMLADRATDPHAPWLLAASASGGGDLKQLATVCPLISGGDLRSRRVSPLVEETSFRDY